MVKPKICPIQYECVDTLGLRCGNELTVNSETGRVKLRTFDMSRFPPGPYEVTLRASSGSISPISVDLSFKVMLIDPCPTAVIARPDQSSADFSDSVYTLG